MSETKFIEWDVPQPSLRERLVVERRGKGVDEAIPRRGATLEDLRMACVAEGLHVATQEENAERVAQARQAAAAFDLQLASSKSYERQLTAALAELKTLREQANALRSQLARAEATIRQTNVELLTADNATLRAQLAAAEALTEATRASWQEAIRMRDALTSPEGRATDEELYAVFNVGIGASRENAIRLVAARVRRERGQGLVERLVAAETSFYVTDEGIGTEVQWQVTVHPNGKMQHSRSDVPAADVPATLARLAGLDGGR